MLRVRALTPYHQALLNPPSPAASAAACTYTAQPLAALEPRSCLGPELSALTRRCFAACSFSVLATPAISESVPPGFPKQTNTDKLVTKAQCCCC